MPESPAERARPSELAEMVLAHEVTDDTDDATALWLMTEQAEAAPDLARDVLALSAELDEARAEERKWGQLANERGRDLAIARAERDEARAEVAVRDGMLRRMLDGWRMNEAGAWENDAYHPPPMNPTTDEARVLASLTEGNNES